MSPLSSNRIMKGWFFFLLFHVASHHDRILDFRSASIFFCQFFILKWMRYTHFFLWLLRLCKKKIVTKNDQQLCINTFLDTIKIHKSQSLFISPLSSWCNFFLIFFFTLHEISSIQYNTHFISPSACHAFVYKYNTHKTHRSSLLHICSIYSYLISRMYSSFKIKRINSNCVKS